MPRCRSWCLWHWERCSFQAGFSQSVDIFICSELRLRTSAPMKKCVEALDQASGDLDEAVTLLRKAGVGEEASMTADLVPGTFALQGEGESDHRAVRCDIALRRARHQLPSRKGLLGAPPVSPLPA